MATGFSYGRTARKFDPRIPHASALMMAAPAAAIPAAKDWADGMPADLGMLLNDQLGDCTCFPAGTLIRMADGTSKPIEKIRLLDHVVTAERNDSIVTQLMCREIDEQIVRIGIWGHNHLRLTKEHPILTKNGYKRAQDLTENDWVAQPSWRPEISDIIFPQEYFTHEETRLIRMNGTYKWKNSKTIVNLAACPEALRLTPEFGRLIGLFLAEGSTNQNTVRWTFGKHEVDTLAQDVVSLLKTELEAHAIKRQRPNGTIDVVLCGKHWRMLFEKLCSKGAGAKTLHPDLWNGTDEFLKSVLLGWLDGDGYNRRGEHIGTTISHSLAQDMYGIAQVLGWKPTISVRTPSLSSNVKSRKDRWDVCVREISIIDNSETTNRAIFETGTTWRKVKEITYEPFCGYVFNLSVKGDESYIAEGIGVHNCAGMLHAMQVWTFNASGSMRSMVDSEALWAYENFAGYNPQDPSTDQGGNEQDILTDWLKQGVMLSDGSRDHLNAFFEVDPRNLADIRRTIYECGVCYIGFNVPQSLENDMSNGGVPQTWDVVQGQEQNVGGHCVILTGYDAGSFDLVSWGSRYKMTDAFFSTFVDETYALVDADWVKATGSTPLGMNLAQLDSQMQAIRATHLR